MSGKTALQQSGSAAGYAWSTGGLFLTAAGGDANYADMPTVFRSRAEARVDGCDNPRD